MDQLAKHGTLYCYNGKSIWKLLGTVPHADAINCEIILQNNVAMIRNFSYPNPIRVNGMKVYHETQLRSKDTIQVAGFILLWFYANSLGEWWRLMQFRDDNRPMHNIRRAILSLDTDSHAKLRFLGPNTNMPPASNREKKMSEQELKLQKEISRAAIISNNANVDMEDLVGM